jgi:hypothetical protein
MKFDMSIEDNFASFTEPDSGIAVFVDSFDNHEFDVRIGSVSKSDPVGSITAKTTEELNRKLEELYLKYQGEV